MTLGQKIKTARLERGMTQKQSWQNTNLFQVIRQK